MGKHKKKSCKVTWSEAFWGYAGWLTSSLARPPAPVWIAWWLSDETYNSGSHIVGKGKDATFPRFTVHTLPSHITGQRGGICGNRICQNRNQCHYGVWCLLGLGWLTDFFPGLASDSGWFTWWLSDETYNSGSHIIGKGKDVTFPPMQSMLEVHISMCKHDSSFLPLNASFAVVIGLFESFTEWILWIDGNLANIVETIWKFDEIDM